MLRRMARLSHKRQKLGRRLGRLGDFSPGRFAFGSIVIASPPKISIDTTLYLVEHSTQ
jgi:hypothetical protein